jgi:ABC-2 type transport system ATP-binding protein
VNRWPERGRSAKSRPLSAPSSSPGRSTPEGRGGPLIEAQHLVKRFRPLRTYGDLVRYPFKRPTILAVDDVSLRIEQGEVFGILGPNGAGKTTLVRMLSTGLVPTSGTACVAGIDVVREPQRVRALIGVVPSDEDSFYYRLSGRRNLEFFASLVGLHGRVGRSRVDEVLELVDMREVADRQFRTYSTGMRQRLSVARGLLGRPEVLFLDEPTRALDPIAAREVRMLIREHIVEGLGRTVILATNQMGEAEALCDRVALVRAGRILSEGSVEGLRDALSYGVRCELRLAELPAGLQEALGGVPGVLAVEVAPGAADEPRSLHLTLAEDGPVVAAVLRETIEHGAEVHGCKTGQVSLEEIFLDTMHGPAIGTEEVAC